MENMSIYEKVKSVPENAKKPIKAGRLQGMTDINPMWRIKKLTETFGPCGVGWKAPIVEKWVEQGADGVKMAFVTIAMRVKVDGEWSEDITGTGGATLIAKETKGMYNDDEAFKKAYTDAISVSCKMLGFGADVYWDGDKTKYDIDEYRIQREKLRDTVNYKIKQLSSMTGTSVQELKRTALCDLNINGNEENDMAMIDAWLDKQLQP